MKLLWTVSLIVAVSSCAEMSELPWLSRSAEAPLVCNSTAPCPPQHRCSFGTCTDVMQEFREVAIAVRLGESTQHLLSVDLSTSTEFNAALNHERMVSGQVRTEEDKGIPATVVARLTESVEGHPVQRQTQTDADGAFALELTQGSVWSLDVIPHSDQIPPPPRRVLRQISGDLVAGREVEIILPPEPDYPLYTGRLLDANSDPMRALTGRPSPGGVDSHDLRLSVIDSQGRQVGSSPLVDDEGNFAFKAHPDTREVVLLLRGDTWAQPAVVSEIIELSPDQTNLEDIVLELRSGRSILSIAATSELSSIPIFGEIRIHPMAADGRVVHRIALSAAQDSELDLPLGSYTIDLLPDPSTGFAPSLGHSVEVRDGGTNALSVLLTPLISLTGTVVTPDGSPAMNVRIVCQQDELLTEALTDENGAFTLKVQEGATFITAIPAPPLPRVLLEMNLGGAQSLDMVIDEGVMLTGSLMRPEARETQGNALITVLAPWKTFDGAAVVLGETVVNSDGMFSVALPPF